MGLIFWNDNERRAWEKRRKEHPSPDISSPLSEPAGKLQLTSGWWQRVNWEQYGCCVYMPVLYSAVSSCELPLEGWSTGRVCLRMCVFVCVCVKERGGMGLRAERWMSNPSWRPTAVVRERWSVRSQHSLSTPDPSSGREQHRGCLVVGGDQNGFRH